MGLLSFLLGKKNKTSVAKELLKDIPARKTLWKEHINNFKKREELSKAFNFGNVENALNNPKATKALLTQIESLISSDLINIDGEEKLDEEIIKDLKDLENGHFFSLANILLSEKNKELTLQTVLLKIHNLVITELHLIKLINNTPDKNFKNNKALLLNLFETIFLKEAALCKPFISSAYSDESKKLYNEIAKLLNLLLSGQELKSKAETPEEKLVGKIAENMQEDEENEYRELAEDILNELVEKAGGEVERGDDEELFARMEKIEKTIKNDKQILAILKKLKTKYDEKMLKIIIEAFRKAHESGNFNIEEQLIG